jgi:DNA replication and repair protein RecF
MYLTKLRLFQFRSFTNFSTEFCAGINLIVGNNAQGKTNLVEAIYLLGALRSFRSAKNKTLINNQSVEGSVFGELDSEDLKSSIGIVLNFNSRTLLINDVKKSLQEYYGRMPVISFTPDDLDLIKGSPETRRSLIDKLVVDLEPGKLGLFKKYSQAIKNKNALLKSGRATINTLSPWNEVIISLTPDIIAERRAALLALEQKTADKIKKISKDIENVKLKLKLDDEEVEFSSDKFRHSLAAIMGREIAAKRCLVGPHLDDILIKLNHQETRGFASQGQSRSLALAIKLAVLDLVAESRGVKPVLILDDFDAEFDAGRLEIMCDLIEQIGTQVFITSTNSGLRGLFHSSNLGMFSMLNNSLNAIK